MKKLYYSIGEISEITSVEPHVLRYWETIFKELSPRKNKAGNRVYREKDITFILQLRELIHEKKFSTAGAKKFLDNKPDAASETKIETPEISYETQKDLKEIRLFLMKLSEKL